MGNFTISKSQVEASSAQLAEEETFDLGYVTLVGCSAAIATLGFGMNSVSVIVGSMIVSPLLTVVVGISASAFRRDWPTLRRGLFSFVVGLLVAVAVASIVAAISPVSAGQAEIAERLRAGATSYYFVALFSGLAAAVAFYWPGAHVASVGIAVAVALVPPLAMMGIGIASLDLAFTSRSCAIAAVNTGAIFVGGMAALILLRAVTKEPAHEDANLGSGSPRPRAHT